MKIICLITFLSLAFGMAVESNQNIITINYPPDKTIMEFGPLGISLSVPQGSATLIKVNVNDKEYIKLVPDQEVECFSVLLSVGINRINITAIKEDKEVDKIAVNVFRRSDLSSEFIKPPVGYNINYFHEKDSWQCTGCHILKPGDSDRRSVNIAAFPSEILSAGAKAAARTSTCYSCHKALTSYPFVHGPAAVWSCLSCHEPGAKPEYAVKKPDTKICFSCHIKQKEDWYGKKYFHGPFTTEKCAICHNPHASENPFNLHKPTWDLCLSCHIDKGSGIHIVRNYLGISSKNHPTRGKPDPLRKGKELSCASCHDPHASDSAKFWRLNVGSGFELCTKCHTD
ncbi:MAG: hypothetical protein HY757_03585 [Nitrospirae bacterium]|nr:hypothetical protein [Nitrospirota bacterium]